MNSIFANYFNDFNVIKNLINIQFIEKIIQLNLNTQSQNYILEVSKFEKTKNEAEEMSAKGKMKYEDVKRDVKNAASDVKNSVTGNSYS
mgnify:CR=1 FL=1